MINYKPTDTPISQGNKLRKEDVAQPFEPMLYKILVGGLLYLTTARPDIMFAPSFVSRFMK